jgi:hypothetical protein
LPFPLLGYDYEFDYCAASSNKSFPFKFSLFLRLVLSVFEPFRADEMCEKIEAGVGPEEKDPKQSWSAARNLRKTEKNFFCWLLAGALSLGSLFDLTNVKGLITS